MLPGMFQRSCVQRQILLYSWEEMSAISPVRLLAGANELTLELLCLYEVQEISDLPNTCLCLTRSQRRPDWIDAFRSHVLAVYSQLATQTKRKAER